MNIFEFWQHETDKVNKTIFAVVGFVPTLGTFEIWRGKIVRTLRTFGTPPTFRPATQHELRELDYAAENGWLQIERRPIYGMIGGKAGHGSEVTAEYPHTILWQAKGTRNR